MKFGIYDVVEKGRRGICKYDKYEFSLTMAESYTNGSLAINNLYVTIDFDIITKQVIGISGFIGDIRKIKNISVGEIQCEKKAILIIEEEKNFVSGVAYNSGIEAKIFYDPKRECIVILADKLEQINNKWYLIAKNIYVAVKEGQLLGILVCPILNNTMFR